MYCKTITKGIFDSYIANDSDTVLEGVVTNTFGNTTFWRFPRKRSTQHHLVSSAQQLLAESPWHCRS